MEKTSKNFKSWRKTKKVIGNYWKILPNLDKTQFESCKNVQKSDNNSEKLENWKILLNIDKIQFESWKKCPKF